LSNSRILRIGHRGCAGHAPENTLAALEIGIALGADYLEMDVQRTRDGQLVLMHDKYVDRTTDGSGKVTEIPWSELSRFDAGNGQRVPSLQDALETASGRAGVILEIKTPGIGVDLHRQVEDFHFSGPVIYASFLHAEIRAVRDRDNNALTMALIEGVPVEMTNFALESGATHAGIALDSMTGMFGDSLRSAEIQVFLYTADTVRQIGLAKEFAPDGIISNFPERI
jgi:glycerophosphoryl diester phosphodiesterase